MDPHTAGERSSEDTTPGGPGARETVPPAPIPLSFLAASGVGIVGFGVAGALAASNVISAPTSPSVLVAVHLGMLAFLSMAVFGAIHQFAPVVGARPLRSVAGAATTFVLFVPSVWLLAAGFWTGPPALVPAAGTAAFAGVCVAAWNLSRPLGARTGGVPIVGLRVSVAFLVVTAGFGVVYAFDRQAAWFGLAPHVVLAHAHLGLIGWLGITYVAVSEKLWPMFLLAHRPSARSGAWSIALLAIGAPLLAAGLLFAVKPVGLAGGVVVTAGLCAHLLSLGSVVRHRRRHLELLHAFVLASATSLVAAIIAGAFAGLAPVAASTRGRIVAVEVVALIGWLGLAIIGHVHKIVPFIVWSRLRATGRISPLQRAVLFADLYRAGAARATFTVAALGTALAIAGTAIAASPVLAVGFALLGAGGGLAFWNLATGPRRALRQAGTATSDV